MNEGQRARLLRIRDWIVMGGFLPPAAVFIVMDTANPWSVVPLALAFLAIVGLTPTGQWLCVRRLPPAERPLSREDICGFLARTQDRGESLWALILATAGTVASLILLAGGVGLVVKSPLRLGRDRNGSVFQRHSRLRGVAGLLRSPLAGRFHRHATG